MLCGCRGNRWPIRCLMTDEVDMVFYNAGCSTLCLASLTASSFPMMFVWGFDFADGNIELCGR